MMFALMNHGDAMAAAAIAIAILMVCTWLVSLVMKNASIVDLIWGFGFVVVGWVTYLGSDTTSALSTLSLVLVTIWGLRLATYLTWRNHGKGEDFRYVAMRKRWGQRFPIISLFTVFGLQGTIMWVVSLPVQLVMTESDSEIGLIAILGAILWAVGLAFEAIGDAQLTRFKSDPSNAGKVMNRGLWRYTRHPNYFGDACVWWGLALIALTVTPWGLVGAALMHLFLRRVSGVTLLEKSLVKRREGYAEYIKVTSAFIPRPPKKS